MRYTVSSDGVVIGETDLGFARGGDAVRAGWFHPNAAGERLLPRIVPPLALHRADGSVVPTRSVDLQDAHQLLALAEWEEARRDAQAWAPRHEGDDDPFAAALDQADGDGDEPFPDDAPGDDPLALAVGWAPDDEPADLPRYQIVLELADADAIP